MDRLHSDPSLLVCPDFTSNAYSASRLSLVSPTISNAQVADLLCAVWVTSNDALHAQWQQQLVGDERLHSKQERLAEEDRERHRGTLRLDDKTAKNNEKKKNRSKHLLIPLHPRPDTMDDEIMVSDFALQKIDKDHYIELCYWTNGGIVDAHANYRTRDDEGMVPTTGEDGSTVWVSATLTKPSTKVAVDRNLSTIEFAQAVPRIIKALEDYDWPAQRVTMLANFWGSIMLHCYWNSPDNITQRAILIYQEKQRRAWHNTIPLPKGAWDISILNKTALLRTFDRVFRALCNHDIRDIHYVHPFLLYLLHELLIGLLTSLSLFRTGCSLSLHLPLCLHPNWHMCLCLRLRFTFACRPTFAPALCLCFICVVMALDLRLRSFLFNTSDTALLGFVHLNTQEVTSQSRSHDFSEHSQSKTSRCPLSPQSHTHSDSPKHRKHNSNPRSSNGHMQRSGFQDSAHDSHSPGVCAVCLGRNAHRFIDCTADHLWDNSHATLATHVDKQLLLHKSDKPLCVNWQCLRGCSSRSHDDQHICSGCLAKSHGAQQCSRAQTSTSTHSL